MRKVLLLSAAAGLLAVGEAKAVDLPAPAKPVERAIICSRYGVGFSYIPDSDTCLKIGGYVRLQTELKAGAYGIVFGSGAMVGAGRFNLEDTNDINWTLRGVATWDARTQTEYGTLRSYIRIGWNQSTPGLSGAGTTPGTYWDRAFIQFAGFTVGRAQSFFDLYTFGGAYSYLSTRTSGDTGATGANIWAYTVQFGNGGSYTLSLEDPAAHNKGGTCDGSAACWAINGGSATNNGFALQGASNSGFRVPDVVANLRIDQAWGYLGVSTAIHDVSGGYYTTPGSVNNGHPSTAYGRAFAVGGSFNLAGGDSLGVNVVWTQGAPGYAQKAGNWQVYDSSQSVAVAWLVDGLFDSATTIQMTKAWSLNVGYQHIWGPAGTFGGKWRSTLYGGYVAVSYNDAARTIINSHLPGVAGTAPCGIPRAGTAWPPVTITPGSPNSCSPDFSFYQVGSRTQFNPHPLIDIGLDVFYTRLNTAYKGSNIAGVPIYPANGVRPAVAALDDQNVLSASMRWQRNFYP